MAFPLQLLERDIAEAKRQADTARAEARSAAEQAAERRARLTQQHN